MARPIWKGSISFGLVNIPVTLYSAEQGSDIHFHLLDKKNKARIRYERINEETGKEVPWQDITRAYEFEKGEYVLVDAQELEKTAYENSKTVEIEDFIKKEALEPIYYEKPYYLIPEKTGEKGYFLLKETLEKTKKIGITKVVIKTRQYLAALYPFQNGLVLNLLRFDHEVRKLEELLDKSELKSYKLSKKEIEMAEQLVENMTTQWNPKKYHDKNRELLSDWIERRIKREKGIVVGKKPKEERKARAEVIDFMALLKKSLAEKKGKAQKSKKSAGLSEKSSSTKLNHGKRGQKKTSSKGRGKR